MSTVSTPCEAIPGESAERRIARRQRMLKAAVAAFNMEFSSIPCVLRNVSETGARLEFGDGSLVPPRFVLHVELDGYKVDCERVWQKGKVCGVRFVSERKPTRVLRSQVLKTSEKALSEGFLREIARRGQIETTPPATPQPQENRPAAAPRPVFGKRA